MHNSERGAVVAMHEQHVGAENSSPCVTVSYVRYLKSGTGLDFLVFYMVFLHVPIMTT